MKFTSNWIADQWRSPRRLSLCTLILAVTAHAQYHAGINGVVTDPHGAAVPEAKVTLSANETNFSFTTKTSDSGVYSFSSLPSGAYRISLEKAGFSKKILNEVRVNAEETRALDVQLEVGQVTESVTVAENSVPLIQSEEATIGGTITSREIQNLPDFARDPLQLVRLAPGVFGDGAQAAGGAATTMPGSDRPSAGSSQSIFFIENGPQITANGTRPNSNNIMVDGIGINSAGWGGSAVLTPNQESVKEIRVVANSYSAENGRNSGAQIMMISQNGTNQIHGSAFFKWHRPGLDAYQRWNGPGTPSPVTRDNNRFNQEGGSIGGPILKNKLFAFFSYETQRNSAVGSTTTWFETPQFRQSAGPGGSLARKILSFPGQDPLAKNPVTLTCAQVGLAATQCHDVPGGLDLGSPLALPLGTADPTFGKTGTPYGIGSGFDGTPDALAILTATPTSSVNQQFNGRLDYQPTQRDLVAFSIYSVPTLAHVVNTRAREVNKWTNPQIAQSWTAIWNHTFSPTLVNEARFGISGWSYDLLSANPGLPWGLPLDTIDSYGNFTFPGWNENGPGIFDQSTWSARDSLTKVHGSHTFKFGGDFSRAKFLDHLTGASRPAFAFRNLWSFANDAPYQETGNFDPATGAPEDAIKNFRYSIIAFYGQDTWKLKRNLTLNLGLRWEYYSPLSEVNGKISDPILGTGTAILTGLTMKQGDLGHTSKRNFAPQIGLAWAPGSLFGHSLRNRLVVRGGFGVGYNPEQLAYLSAIRYNSPFTTSLTLNSTNCCILYSTPADVTSFSNWPSNPSAIRPLGSNGLPTSGPLVGLSGFPETQNQPHTYRYSVDVQYNLGRSWVASVGYQGSQTRNYERAVNENWLNYENRNPIVSGLTYYLNDASANHNALLTQITHRFSKSFTVDFQYMFSSTRDQGSKDGYQDLYPFDINAWWGPADNDVTHTFKLYGVWTPTIFRGTHGWLEKVAGGWTLSGISTFHSGFPWTPTYPTRVCLLYANSCYGTLRPGSYMGGSSGDFSNATFMSPNGQFPNGSLAYFTLPTFTPAPGPIPPVPGVGRNSFRGPNYRGIDMMLAKAIGLPNTKILGENARLNLELHAFNVFNLLNLSPTPIASISTDGVHSNPQFGQVQSAFAGRIVELQARLRF